MTLDDVAAQFLFEVLSTALITFGAGFTVWLALMGLGWVIYRCAWNDDDRIDR